MQVAVPVSALGAKYSSFCQALVSILSPFYERFVRKTGALEVTEHLVTQLGAFNQHGHFTVFFHRVDVKVHVFGEGTLLPVFVSSRCRCSESMSSIATADPFLHNYGLWCRGKGQV
jgi:hypothetical protein